MSEISDLAASCVRCGFCLESCPTFRITGDESESPRGRIYLARSVDDGSLDLNEDVRRSFDTCVGCRACETACPSAVRYGELIETVRDKAEQRSPRRAVHRLLDHVTDPRRLRASLALAGLLPRMPMPSLLARGLTKERQVADLPRLPERRVLPDVDETSLPLLQGQVALLEGCAMGVMYPDVHEATRRLLRRVGFQSTLARGCCGALHAHNGRLDDARRMAKAVMAEGDALLVVNAAGCGSWLKEASTRPVQDVTEFLAAKGLAPLLERSQGFGGLAVVYQDACHLSHGQRITMQPRALLAAVPGLRVLELAEPGACCGSGGVYNVLQPTRAKKMLDAKWADIKATGARLVVTANPGCHGWIAQAAREDGGGIEVVHIASLLEASFTGF
ncbi:MAG: (Fe-S)-binding protein [Armatimonadetes bacterium]|nr:(Fe-S)-binding protein [Armatimonadota bacterium]